MVPFSFTIVLMYNIKHFVLSWFIIIIAIFATSTRRLALLCHLTNDHLRHDNLRHMAA